MTSQPRYAAESTRLYLEPLSIEKHLLDFHELWVDEVAVRWTIGTPKKSLDETRQWFPSILPSTDVPDIDKFAVMLKPVSTYRSRESRDQDQDESENDNQNETGNENKNEEKGDDKNERAIGRKSEKPKCIGIVGTNRWSDQGMETGYALNRRYWGKGYATEAFGLFLRLFWGLRERQGIDRLVAKVYAENAASISVLRKCGGWEGDVLKGVEMRGAAGERGDLHCWYFNRPFPVGDGGEEEKDVKKEGGDMV